MRTLNPWIKITAMFEPGFDLAVRGLAEVRAFEAHFRIQHLYFSRYVTTLKNSIEISCQTNANPKSIRRWFNNKSYVLAIAIENRGTGSLAHAHGYRLICALPPSDKDGEVSWNDMLDVFHWMCNMRGYDYLREIRFYSYAAFCFSNQVAKQNDEFQAKLSGKAPDKKAAAAASKRAPQSKPAGSSRAASRRASG